MGDRIIITEDEPAPAPQIIVVEERKPAPVEKIVTEKTTVIKEEGN